MAAPRSSVGAPGPRYCRQVPDGLRRSPFSVVVPCCLGDGYKKCHRVRKRYIEDIPANLKAEVPELLIHRDWCPRRQKSVEPAAPDALPNSTLGHRVLVLTAWLPYALGNTLWQVLEVFNFHLPIPLTAGGLNHRVATVGEILAPWYQTIHREALESAGLHADETSWRAMGKTHGVWCFDRGAYLFCNILAECSTWSFLRKQQSRIL